jgi:transposase
MKNGKVIAVKRKFDEEFKKHLVSEYESGKFRVLELSRLHGISFQNLYKWIYRYSSFNKPNTQIVEMKDSSSVKVKALENRLKELEQIVGRKQIRIDYLEKLIEFTKDHYG